MVIYLCLTGFYFLCIISSTVCDICSTCSCSSTLERGPIIDCHEKNLKSNDIINFDLLMLNENVLYNKLILSKNDIITLPEHLIKKLKFFKSLDLSENIMKEIHVMTYVNLTNLEDLNLSKNTITTFDDSLLTVLPELLSLNLSYNDINLIENTADKILTAINTLDLSHNNISNLPNKFFDPLTNLQYLDLSFNRIHSLEENNLLNLNSLKTIYINNNFLTSLNFRIFPKSLIELHSGYNLITDVLYEPSQIEVLNIEYNQISEIDTNLKMLNYLQHLNVSGNILPNFPNTLCENLKTLDISHNKLVSIPETLSVKNFPLLRQLNVGKNPIQNLTFSSDLNLNLFMASNISMLEVIDKATFAKLRVPSTQCINLTISNNERLSTIHEEAFEHLNLCSLDLSNNGIDYVTQKLVSCNTSSIACSINLQGNPFKCNCSMQWMLDDMVPKLYSDQPNLLNNLRCASPPQLANIRMVHWYGWKDQVFCSHTSNFSENLTMKVANVLDNTKTVMFDSSTGLLAVLGTTICVLSILIILGIVWTRRLYMKKRRINRKF
ncbi:leucine-rich repeat neuronal protein 2-like [Colletes gigas]|uniref:leucine-rich repeat neuronal protein 2-like n=1 Tax=Colletes gigas TaxID=935657 RepID=UPI001C9B919D|nr:leucine-rich repeat neuronal protein 2-like [Colletes gigas]